MNNLKKSLLELDTLLVILDKKVENINAEVELLNKAIDKTIEKAMVSTP